MLSPLDSPSLVDAVSYFTEAGKTIQALLALAFLEAGAKKLTNRPNLGIDLEFKWGGRKIAIEIKTSAENDITISNKDIEGLQSQLAKGVCPYIAFLGGGIASDWFFFLILKAV